MPQSTLRQTTGLLSVVIFGVAVGILISSDPYVATLVSEDIWQMFAVYDFPFKVSFVILGVAVLGSLGYSLTLKARDFPEIQIVTLLFSMQLVAVGAAGLDPIDLLSVTYLALLVAQLLADPSRPLRMPLLVFFAMAFGILALPYVIVDRPAHFVVAIIKYGKTAILSVLIVNIVTNERLVNVFIKTLVTVAILSASVGIAQVVIFAMTGTALVMVEDFDEAMKPTPFGMMLRAHGFNSETHTLMSFLLMALPFSLLLTAKAQESKQRVRHALGMAVIVVAIVLTWSYGGLVGVAVVLGLFPIFVWPGKTIHYLAGIIFLLVLIYATGFYADIYAALSAEASMSTGIFQRKTLALVTVDELSRNPWIGRGLDTVQFFSGNYWPRTVHNAYLQAWAYLGPIGFLLFTFMLLLYTTGAMILGFSGSGDREYRFRMLALALIAFLVIMIAEPYMYSASTWVLLGFVQAVMLIYRPTQQRRVQ